MTAMSRTERAFLCDLALQVGGEDPTLCEGWSVKDLVAHLVLRERSPAAVGVVVPPLSRLTEAGMRRLRAEELPVLVDRLRHGPPAYSPLRLPPLDRLANTAEFFVHHEDIRRARPGWAPRILSGAEQAVLWKVVRTAGKGLLRGSSAAVVAERSDTGEAVRLRGGDAPVVLRGLPAEICLYLFGRRDHAVVELGGDDASVARLRAHPLRV